MKTKTIFITSTIIGLLLLTLCSGQDNDSPYSGPYLGQQPPGKTPELFAPKILSRTKPEWAFCAAFAPDEKAFYFVSDGTWTNHEQIMCMKRENGRWSPPAPTPLNSSDLSNNFGLSPDGKRIFFRSWRPLRGKNRKEPTSSLWYAEKARGEWQEPVPLMCGGQFVQRVGQPSVSVGNTLYFASVREDSLGKGDIYRSFYVNDSYSAPENLGNLVNTEYSEADLCVAPDESYMIVTCWDRPDTRGESDLYISFREKNGIWTVLKNMGQPINNEGNESAPTLTPDGKHLIYLRATGSMPAAKCDTYWVSLDIVEDLRARGSRDLSMLQGPDLGQPSPGKTPEIFAPGIVSTGYNEPNIVFSPDGLELFYGLYAISSRLVFSGSALL